jgi:hypothetical protein
MSKTPRITKPGHCSACGLKFQPETEVVRTNGDATVCAGHDWMFIPEVIIFRGRFDESKREA